MTLSITVTALLWTLCSFWLGAIPFSVWLGQLVLQTDIRTYGDGNPGATNAWKAGGWRLGLPALFLDYLKGAIPVGVAHFRIGLTGWSLAAVVLAPVFGHVFSPFLRFRGGKALAVTFGVWTGLTLSEYPVIFGSFLGLFLLVQTVHGWAVTFGVLTVLVYQLFFAEPIDLLIIWGINGGLLIWKYRSDLRETPRLRSLVR
ncbi:glycerol-3-phosphate acyltransferase [Chloroflexi bacterium TSY]|nr:glycerol-3-phosphate acyltransferase [Chloroflexi bacterium TSY]